MKYMPISYLLETQKSRHESPSPVQNESQPNSILRLWDMPAHTFRFAPHSTMYSQVFGSVRTTIQHPQWCRIVNDQIRVLRYVPVCCFSALNRTPLPIRSPQPSHQTLKGISNLQCIAIHDRSAKFPKFATNFASHESP